MSWWDEIFRSCLNQFSSSPSPKPCDFTGDCATGAGSMKWSFRVSISSCWKKWTCPTGWREDGRVDVWSFTYICYNCNCYLLVYAFFDSCLSSQCVSLYHIYWYLLHMSVLPSVYPSLCVSMLLLLFPPKPWGYAPFGGSATEANSGHRPVDEPWQTNVAHGVGIGDWCSRSKDDYLKTVRSSWLLQFPWRIGDSFLTLR